MNTLGNKIRVFRRLKGLSQLDLEVLIGASSGVISRIESNVTNPTKETLDKISRALKLNSLEYSYLNGNISKPPNIREIEEARSILRPYYRQLKTLSYCVDDRSRLIDISDCFCKLGRFDKEKILLKYMPQILFDNSLGINKFIDKNYLNEIAYNMFLRTYSEMYFMEGDEDYENILQYIKSNPLALELWNIASKESKDKNFRDNASRTVMFSVFGKKIKLQYAVEPLWGNHRFMVLHYRTL